MPLLVPEGIQLEHITATHILDFGSRESSGSRNPYFPKTRTVVKRRSFFQEAC